MKKQVVKTIIFLLVSFGKMIAMDIGSDTAVTRFTTQQVVNDGDRIAGFAALEAGFRLNGTNVSGTFDSFFPVSGCVELNGGTLTLGRDLILNNVSWVGLLGDIIGDGHAFELAASVTCIPAVNNTTCCGLILITETDEDDNVGTVDWSYNSKYLAFGTDINTATEPLGVYSFNGTALTLVDQIAIGDGTESEINSVRWHPSALLFGMVRQSTDGAEIFIYSFDGSTITEESSDGYAADCNACVWHTSGDYFFVGGENVTEEICVYPVSSGGILGTPLFFDISPSRDVQFESMDIDVTGSYLAVGVEDNGTDDTFLIYEFNDEPSLSLVLNVSDDPGAATFSVSWNRTYTDVVAVGLGGTGTTRVILYRHDAGAGTLTQINTISVPFTSPIEGVHWTPDGSCIAIGSDEVGTGAEDARVVTFHYNNSTGDLTQVTRIDEGDDTETLRYSPDGCFLAHGDDGFGDPTNLSVYATAFGLLTKGCVTFTDVKVVLNCNVCMQNCCLIFSGESSLNGQGYCLELEPTCTIIVDFDSSLLIKDIQLKGIEDNQLYGLDMNSTISFQDVTIVLDDDFTFTQGRFDVIKDLDIVGKGHKFTYQSEGVSKVQKCGKFLFDRGVTFSYDPPIASQELLQLTDDTSTIILNGATFHTTTTGIRISKGVFEVRSKSFLSAEGATEDVGILFGDAAAGTSVDLRVRPAARLEVLQGCFQLDNV